MIEQYSTDELMHWGIPGKHKYIAKIGEGINAKYFYTQQQIDAYKNGLKGKVNNAAQNVQKKMPTANQVRQTASNIAKNAPGAANRAAMATRKAAVNAAGAALVNTKAGSKVLARQRNTAAASGDTATLKRLNSFEKYRASNVKQRINNNEYVKAAKATGEAAKAVGKAGKAVYQFAKTPYGKQVIKEVATNAVKQSKVGRAANSAKIKAANTVYNVADTAEKITLANTKDGQARLNSRKQATRSKYNAERSDAKIKYDADRFLAENKQNSLVDRVLKGKPKKNTIGVATAERNYQNSLADINRREASEMNQYNDIEKYNVKNAAKRAIHNTKAVGHRTMNKAKAAGRDVANSAKQAVENKAMSVVRNDAHNKSFESPLYTERTYTSTNTLSNKPITVKKRKKF